MVVCLITNTTRVPYTCPQEAYKVLDLPPEAPAEDIVKVRLCDDVLTVRVVDAVCLWHATAFPL